MLLVFMMIVILKTGHYLDVINCVALLTASVIVFLSCHLGSVIAETNEPTSLMLKGTFKLIYIKCLI